MSLVVGTTCLTDGQGTKYEPEEYIYHPHYQHDAAKNSFSGRGNDIAVIRVKGTFEFNDRVQPIEYATDVFPDDVEALFTGWGRMEVSILCCFHDNAKNKF